MQIENLKITELKPYEKAGTGTTMIACEKLGMYSYMIDIEPKYIDVIVQRYVDYTGNNKIKKNGKEITWK